MCDKHLAAVVTQPTGFLFGMLPLSRGKVTHSEQPLFGLQVNRGKLYANVTFS